MSGTAFIACRMMFQSLPPSTPSCVVGGGAMAARAIRGVELLAGLRARVGCRREHGESEDGEGAGKHHGSFPGERRAIDRRPTFPDAGLFQCHSIPMSCHSTRPRAGDRRSATVARATAAGRAVRRQCQLHRFGARPYPSRRRTARLRRVPTARGGPCPGSTKMLPTSGRLRRVIGARRDGSHADGQLRRNDGGTAARGRLEDRGRGDAAGRPVRRAAQARAAARRCRPTSSSTRPTASSTPRATNAVLVCHALNASHHVAGYLRRRARQRRLVGQHGRSRQAARHRPLLRRRRQQSRQLLRLDRSRVDQSGDRQALGRRFSARHRRGLGRRAGAPRRPARASSASPR